MELTPTIICREALVEFAKHRFNPGFPPEILGKPKQTYISVVLDRSDLNKSIDEFSKIYIQKQVLVLSKDIPEGAQFIPLFGSETYRGTSMRFLLNYNINQDETMGIFDCLYQPDEYEISG